jgi:2-keto-4-pentenoate hydratase/2-oxohepta-3-ene-1,7-dioic acid hydratase in catechol pathway
MKKTFSGVTKWCRSMAVGVFAGKGVSPMKLIRFVSEQGKTLYGTYNEQRPERSRILRGDFAVGFEETGEEAAIRRLLAPVDPPNVLALGLNYRKHADETRVSYPEIPVIFIKANTTVIGPGETILLPAAGPDKVDYECELAIVIGKKTKNVTRAASMECIFGYTCANDVSARDWQIEKQKKQWARGKSFDTFCPLGPWIVTKDEIPDANALKIRTVLNGETLQDSNTSDMIFDVPTIVSDLSSSITLLPGTVILTGTPAGVGFTRKPAVYLKDGDSVTIEIERIGQLTNPVRRE